VPLLDGPLSGGNAVGFANAPLVSSFTYKLGRAALDRLPCWAMLAAMLVVTVVGGASAQSQRVLAERETRMQTPAKPMTPEREGWLKNRCAQLVAFFDRYGVSRSENSDGPRNHTRIGAAIACERHHYRACIDTMAALLVRKAFEVPKPRMAAVEAEDRCRMGVP
jgi:hypothetical protein